VSPWDAIAAQKSIWSWALALEKSGEQNGKIVQAEEDDRDDYRHALPGRSDDSQEEEGQSCLERNLCR